MNVSAFSQDEIKGLLIEAARKRRDSGGTIKAVELIIEGNTVRAEVRQRIPAPQDPTR